jgi:oligopeptide/dipeptide ABC transporter ATP-binding protein
VSKKEEKKNSKESVDDVKMTEKDADAAKTAGAEDDGTQAQKENTDAENPKEASQSSESQSADGIDTKKKDAKDALIEELQDKLGIAYLFIAHDLLVVHHISDRIAVMYLGRVVEIADADELNASPIHPYTQSLLSAVPYPDPKMAKERQRIILEGDVPSPLHMPTGCAFRTRCKYATEQCAKECPTLTDRGNGHQVACWNK